MYMMNRLTPEQVAKLWNIIKFAVENSLPPTAYDHPDRMNRILSSALSGKIEVWAAYDKSEEENKFYGIVLTQIINEIVSDTKSLLIYCLYGYNAVDKDMWLEGLKTTVKYAKSRQCKQIVAYSKLDHIISIASSIGGDCSYRFISFDVDKLIQKLN